MSKVTNLEGEMTTSTIIVDLYVLVQGVILIVHGKTPQ